MPGYQAGTFVFRFVDDDDTHQSRFSKFSQTNFKINCRNLKPTHSSIVIMFSRASPLIRTASRSVAAPSLARSAASFRGMSTIAEALTANDASKLSCYSEIDYAINEDAPVYEAIQKMSAYDIGCLVTTDSKGRFFFCGLSTCQKRLLTIANFLVLFL
jgi:hypothetical protein